MARIRSDLRAGFEVQDSAMP